MSVAAWLTLALSVPVLLLGEFLVRRVRLLERFSIPAPVAGGLVVALLLLLVRWVCGTEVRMETGVSACGWTWFVCAGAEWRAAPVKNVSQPFLVAFFACIGLNASWTLFRRGSLQILAFLAAAAGLAVVQNLVGAGLAGCMGFPRLLGLMCGSVALTGGHGTVMGFAPEFTAAGVEAAQVVGVSAATFGLVAGGLLGGPLGGALIRAGQLRAEASGGGGARAATDRAPGFLSDVRGALRIGWGGLAHLLLLGVCVKLGAWVSLAIQRTGITFPVYMGAMILGVALRNAADLSPRRWVCAATLDRFASIALGVFLSVAMMSLNLSELGGVAGAMLVILTVQVAVIALYVWLVTFPLMGRDYEAAVMAGGHCGFGLGAMPAAMANMKALAERNGPAPRAFLVVPITGTFLIDLLNATNITVFLNLLKGGAA